MSHLLSDLFFSLLPARYRRHYQVDPVSGTICSGIVQTVLAFAIYTTLFFRFLEEFGAFSGRALASPGLAGENLYWTAFGLGAIGWLAFSISPAPLLAMYFMIEGVVRTFAGVTVHESVASLPFWLLGEAHGWLDRRRAQQRLAPRAPDMVELRQSGTAWDLRVTSVRPKPDWRSLVQVEYNGVLYHILSGGEEMVDGTARFRYYLKGSTEVGAFRGIVLYDPFEYWKPGDN